MPSFLCSVPDVPKYRHCNRGQLISTRPIVCHKLLSLSECSGNRSMQRIDLSWLISSFALDSSFDLDLDLNILKEGMRVTTRLIKIVNYIETATAGSLRQAEVSPTLDGNSPIDLPTSGSPSPGVPTQCVSKSSPGRSIFLVPSYPELEPRESDHRSRVGGMSIRGSHL
jgi:hypothetical protein